MVNPEVQCAGDLVLSKEACFSVPDVSEVVQRHPHCTVTFTNEERKQQTIELSGLAAFCIQHEIDHLDGVLFIDHLSRLKKSLVMKKQKKLKKRRAQVRLQMQREFEEDQMLYVDSTTPEHNTRKRRTVKERKKILISKKSRKKNRSKKKK